VSVERDLEVTLRRQAAHPHALSALLLAPDFCNRPQNTTPNAPR
jgi:hypothetical protein